MEKVKRNILYFQTEKVTMGRETSKMPSLLFMLTVQDILNTHLVSLFKYTTSILRSCILRSYTQNSQKLYLNTPFLSPNCILKVQISICIYHQRKKIQIEV